jgi:hypothetical protein
MSALTSHLRKYTAAPVCHDIQINGQLVGLHDSGVLWWPDEATLIVADLHLEKGSSFARRGIMLPPYDTATTLEKLAAVMDAFDPAGSFASATVFMTRTVLTACPRPTGQC